MGTVNYRSKNVTRSHNEMLLRLWKLGLSFGIWSMIDKYGPPTLTCGVSHTVDAWSAMTVLYVTKKKLKSFAVLEIISLLQHWQRQERFEMEITWEISDEVKQLEMQLKKIVKELLSNGDSESTSARDFPRSDRKCTETFECKGMTKVVWDA